MISNEGGESIRGIGGNRPERELIPLKPLSSEKRNEFNGRTALLKKDCGRRIANVPIAIAAIHQNIQPEIDNMPPQETAEQIREAWYEAKQEKLDGNLEELAVTPLTREQANNLAIQTRELWSGTVHEVVTVFKNVQNYLNNPEAMKKLRDLQRKMSRARQTLNTESEKTLSPLDNLSNRLDTLIRNILEARGYNDSQNTAKKA